VIVSRKFAVPGLPRPHLPRERLLEKLAGGRGLGCRATLLLGGPGTGKTTLLSHYANRMSGKLPVAWFNLGPAESDPVVLFQNLFACLQLAAPDLAERPLEIVAGLGEAGAGKAVALLCDLLSQFIGEAGALVILDGTHNLATCEATLEMLDALIHYLPDGAQLVLSGRSLPPLKLARLDLLGGITRIDGAELGFTGEETYSLLRLAAPDSGEAEARATADRIASRTGGWASGVGYAVPTGAGAAALDAPGPVYDFIDEEILSGLDAPVLEKLLAASFLESLDERAIVRLFGSGSAEFFEALAKGKGLGSGSEGNFSLQPLVREALQRHALTRLARESRVAMFRRLAETAGDVADGIAFYLHADEWARAEAHLLGALPAMLETGRKATVRTWIDRFPRPWLERSARLLYVLGELTRMEADLVSSLRHLTEAERLSNEVGPAALLGVVFASRAVVHGTRGEVDLLHEFALRALAELPVDAAGPIASCQNVLASYHLSRQEIARAEAAFHAAMRQYLALGDVRGQSRVQHNLGLARARSGDFRGAAAHYLEALRLADAGRVAAYPLTFNNLALCRVYLGDPEAAWQAVEQGVALAQRLEATRDQGVLLRTVARLHMDGGKLGQAREALDGALGLAVRTGDRASQRQAYLVQAEVAIAEGLPAAASLAIQCALADSGTGSGHQISEEVALLQTEVALAEGRLEAAAEWLSGLDQSRTDDRSAFLESQVARLRHAAALCRGDEAEAKRYREEMNRAARERGYKLPAAVVAAPEDSGDIERGTGPEAAKMGAAPPTGIRGPASGAPIKLAVRLLGGFEVKVDGRRVPARDWRSSKARLAFAYLVLRPDGVSREQLIELLYPRDDPARSAVNVTITRIRYALDPDAPRGAPSRFVLFHSGAQMTWRLSDAGTEACATDATGGAGLRAGRDAGAKSSEPRYQGGGTYALNRGIQLDCDVIAFREALAAAEREENPAKRRARLEEAVGLYGGHFLPDFSLPLWCEIERERLRREAGEAYEAIFGLLAAADDWRTLETQAGEWLAHDPVAEYAHRARIVALAMQEHTDEALRAGQLARKAMAASGLGGISDDLEVLLSAIGDGSLTLRQVTNSFS